MCSWALSSPTQTISVCSRRGDLSGHLPGSTKVTWVLTPPLKHPTLASSSKSVGKWAPVLPPLFS